MKRTVRMIISVGLSCFLGGCSMAAGDNTGKSAMSEPVQTYLNKSGEISTDAPSASPDSAISDDNGYFIKMTGNRPFGLAFDNAGNLYVVTAPPTGAGTLSKVTPEGKIEKVAVLDGSFIGPGIDTDKDGNVYVTAGDKLLKVLPDGTVSTIADGFSRCFDLEIDEDGCIYVIDDLEDSIYLLSPQHVKTLLYKGNSKGSFVLTSLVFDNHDNLYVAENGSILKFGVQTDKSLQEPEVLAEKIRNLFFVRMDDGGNIFYNTNDALVKISKDGESTEDICNNLKSPVSFKPGGPGFDEKALYIAVSDGIYKCKP